MIHQKKFIFLFFLCIVYSLPFSLAWRSELFPEDWQPIDKIGAVEGVNVFTNAEGTKDENGKSVSDGHAAYHPTRFLHDFSYAGYHKGEKPIPPLDANSWAKSAKIYNVVTQYGCVADGKMDCRAAIQNAIDAAGAAGGGVVYLPAGEYKIASPYSYFLKIRKGNVVIRGAGVDATKIKVNPYWDGKFTMNNKNVFLVDGGSSWLTESSARVKITRDILTHTKVIPIEDTSLFRVGDPIVIKTVGRTTSYLNEHDMQNTWNSNEPAYVFRREITAIDPVKKMLTIDVPTRYRVRTTDFPVVVKVSSAIKEVGFEEFSIGQIRHPAEWDWTGDIIAARDNKNPAIIYDMWQTRLFKWLNVEDGWMYNIKSYRPEENVGRYTSNTKFGKYEVEVLNEIALLSFSRQITLNNLYFKNAQADQGSSNGYAIRVEGSENLIEKLTVERFKKGFAIENQWATGNVIKDSMTKNSLDTSDLFHWELSVANLIDNHVLDGTYWKTIIMATPGQGHSSSESVFWNTNGLRKPDVAIDSRYDRDNDNNGKPDYEESHGDLPDIAIIISNQYGNGYVIGTYGPFSDVITPVMQKKIDNNPYRPYALPRDFREGISYDKSGLGALEPRSLYEAQLALRLNKKPLPQECIDSDGDGFGQGCSFGIDCNDANAAVHPGVTEICSNGIDEDCSGNDLICSVPVQELIIDNKDSGFTTLGYWPVSSASGYYGTNSVYSRLAGSKASWQSSLEPGTYEVFAWWTAWNSRATNAPYSFYNSNDTSPITSVRVNQRDTNLGGKWNSLGTYSFSEAPRVVLTAESEASYSADAVRFVRR